jgi:hypothetical protein
MASETGFGFDDQIYWTFIKLVTTVHKSLSDTLSSSSTGHPTGTIMTELNCQLLLASHYIASGWTIAQKTHPLPSNGYMQTHIKTPLATPVLLLFACITGIA